MLFLAWFIIFAYWCSKIQKWKLRKNANYNRGCYYRTFNNFFNYYNKHKCSHFPIRRIRICSNYGEIVAFIFVSVISIIGFIVTSHKPKHTRQQQLIEKRVKAEEQARLEKETAEAALKVPQMHKEFYESQIQHYKVDKAKKISKYGFMQCYVWIENNCFCMFPVFEQYYDTVTKDEMCSAYTLATITLSDIEHYKVEGEIYRENKTFNSGLNAGRAIGGLLMMGEAGAIIGSRQETESELITHDERVVVLTHFQNGERDSIKFKYEDFQVFEDLVPEKNYDVVTEIKRQKLIRQALAES